MGRGASVGRAVQQLSAGGPPQGDPLKRRRLITTGRSDGDGQDEVEARKGRQNREARVHAREPRRSRQPLHGKGRRKSRQSGTDSISYPLNSQRSCRAAEYLSLGEAHSQTLNPSTAQSRQTDGPLAKPCRALRGSRRPPQASQGWPRPFVGPQRVPPLQPTALSRTGRASCGLGGMVEGPHGSYG